MFQTLEEGLQYYRERAGLSRQQLAEILGISVSTVQNYEKGKTRPDIQTLQRIAIALHVPIDVLYRLTDEEYRRIHDREYRMLGFLSFFDPDINDQTERKTKD